MWTGKNRNYRPSPPFSVHHRTQLLSLIGEVNFERRLSKQHLSRLARQVARLSEGGA